MTNSAEGLAIEPTNGKWRRLLFSVLFAALAVRAQSQGRVIEVTADHDSRFKIAGMAKPVITVTAGEAIVLRITAIKAKTHNRDGSVHGFTLLRGRDRKPVEGWDFLLQPGIQDFAARAPLEPGEYEVVCTVICSAAHEGMNMKFVVLPAVN